ncbi:MAG: hypothetical protein C9356_15800 [Oleiphilus sp.]|nr:MAG: hypothetical protein C9356_15800 [Oleiphilus sp.]
MIINFDSINYAYPGANQPVFQGLSFEAEIDGVTSIVGDNGSGKTTLLRLMSQVIYPTAGHITYSPNNKLKIGYLPSSGGLHSHLTVRESIKLRVGLIRQDIDATIVESFKLQELLDRKHHALSRGQLQRVRLAAFFMQTHDLYLLDEPTTGLDLGSSFEFESIISAIKSSGRNIILATHNVNEIENLSDQIITISPSKQLTACTLSSLYANYGNFKQYWSSTYHA